MAHFKAKQHRKTVCNFEKYELMANLAVTTVQTWVKRKSGKQNEQFLGDFFTSTIFLSIFQFSLTTSVIHGWKALKVRNFLVKQIGLTK